MTTVVNGATSRANGGVSDKLVSIPVAPKVELKWDEVWKLLRHTNRDREATHERKVHRG